MLSTGRGRVPYSSKEGGVSDSGTKLDVRALSPYRDTSLMRNQASLGPYRRTSPMVALGGAVASHERGTPVALY